MKKALESKLNYKHSACLIRGGKIVSFGLNKNKCGRLIEPIYGEKGTHAELDCLKSIDPELIKDSTLYVAGWSKGQNIVCSKPCVCCQKYLQRFRLKGIYYSMPDGSFERMII